jgi:hypothetical protein
VRKFIFIGFLGALAILAGCSASGSRATAGSPWHRPAAIRAVTWQHFSSRQYGFSVDIPEPAGSGLASVAKSTCTAIEQCDFGVDDQVEVYSPLTPLNTKADYQPIDRVCVGSLDSLEFDRRCDEQTVAFAVTITKLPAQFRTFALERAEAANDCWDPHPRSVDGAAAAFCQVATFEEPNNAELIAWSGAYLYVASVRGNLPVADVRRFLDSLQVFGTAVRR